MFLCFVLGNKVTHSIYIDLASLVHINKSCLYFKQQNVCYLNKCIYFMVYISKLFCETKYSEVQNGYSEKFYNVATKIAENSNY